MLWGCGSVCLFGGDIGIDTKMGGASKGFYQGVIVVKLVVTYSCSCTVCNLSFYTTKRDSNERNEGRSTHGCRGSRRDAHQKGDSAHEREQGGDSSGRIGDTKCYAGARVGNAHGNTSVGK